MPKNHYQHKHRVITRVARCGTFIALVLLLHACTPEETTTTPVVDAPPEIPTSIASDTPVLPLPQSVPVVADLPAPQAAPVQHLDEALLDAVHRGMTPDEVEVVIGFSGVVVGGGADTVVVRRWTDSAGNSFTARFDKGVLRTRSRLRTPSRPPSEPSAAPEENALPVIDVDGRPMAEIAPGVFVPLERAIASANDQPMGIGQANQPPPAPENRRDNTVVKTPAAMGDVEQRGPTVAIAGATRREQEGDETRKSAYEPHAQLPGFTRSMPTGRFEIRLLNTTDTTMKVGIRQDKLGEDFEIPAAGRASIFVDKGVYGLSFICDDEPYTRYDANPISIDGFRATDVEVHLSPEDVDVRLIDYSLPEVDATE